METYNVDDCSFLAVMRAVLSHKLHKKLPLKLYYHGPMFRYERPQKGRLRQVKIVIGRKEENIYIYIRQVVI